MNIMSYYGSVYDAVYKGEPELYFNKQYHLYTADKSEKYYAFWLDYLIDTYSKYRSANFTQEDSVAFAVLDGLEELV